MALHCVTDVLYSDLCIDGNTSLYNRWNTTLLLVTPRHLKIQFDDSRVQHIQHRHIQVNNPLEFETFEVLQSPSVKCAGKR